MSETRRRRTRVDLPPELVKSFNDGLLVAGVPGSTVIHGWLTQAARFAREGQLDRLPVQSSAPPSTGEQDRIYYPMSVDDSRAVVTALKDAGSSARAVLAACIVAWEAAGYSLVEMQWPTRQGVAPAAAA
ncbi:hypothetical protein [Pseudonocardia sp. NPDC049635]|uniref:hypothetical protein n=1 Tax=Pseudonocardia sp. NPDC049635 TaxID=3155506 RepID=UPI00340CD189